MPDDTFYAGPTLGYLTPRELRERALAGDEAARDAYAARALLEAREHLYSARALALRAQEVGSADDAVAVAVDRAIEICGDAIGAIPGDEIPF